jgi:ankyrin repeat protein
MAEQRSALEHARKLEGVISAIASGTADDVLAAARETSGLHEVKDANGRTAVHMAAQRNDPAVLSALLDPPINLPIDTPDSSGMTPLAIAAASGKSHSASTLIRRNASVNATSPDGALPIHHAAAGGHADTVRLLLDSGSNADCVSSAGTPLALAAGSALPRAVSELIHRVSEPDSGDASLSPALMASISGSQECLRLVLEGAGASATRRNEGCMTPLHAAASHPRGTCGMIRTLLNAGANPDATDDSGVKPVHAAASANKRDVVDELLQHTSDISEDIDELIASWNCQQKSSEVQSADSSGIRSERVNRAQENEQHSQRDHSASEQIRQRGKELMLHGDLGGAESAFVEAISSDCSNVEAHLDLARAKHKAGDSSGVFENASRAIEVDDRNLEGYKLLGEAAENLQRWEDAALAYNSAMALDERDESIQLALKRSVNKGRKAHGKQPLE